MLFLFFFFLSFFYLSPNHSERANLNHRLTFRGCLRRRELKGSPPPARFAACLQAFFFFFFPFVRDESRVVTAKSE